MTRHPGDELFEAISSGHGVYAGRTLFDAVTALYRLAGTAYLALATKVASPLRPRLARLGLPWLLLLLPMSSLEPRDGDLGCS